VTKSGSSKGLAENDRSPRRRIAGLDSAPGPEPPVASRTQRRTCRPEGRLQL